MRFICPYGLTRELLSRGSQLKRAVVTSSTASIFDSSSSGRLDENSWNESSITLVKEKGKDASNMEKYRASKSLAEKGKQMLFTTRSQVQLLTCIP